MHARDMRREGRRARARYAHALGQLARVELAQVLLAQPQPALAGDFLAQAARLRGIERDAEVPAPYEVSVQPMIGEKARDLIHGGEHLALQPVQGLVPSGTFIHARGAREGARHPAAVARRGAEAGALALEHDDVQRGLRALEVVGRPQARVASADDRHVGLRRSLQRRAQRRRAAERLPPEAKVSVAHPYRLSVAHPYRRA